MLFINFYWKVTLDFDIKYVLIYYRQSNPSLIEYMKINNLSAEDLHALFMRNVIPLLAENTNPVVWQVIKKLS